MQGVFMTYNVVCTQYDAQESVGPADWHVYLYRLGSLQIFETQEMLGMYGKSPNSHGNYYIATGDCGHILTGGTLAGMIISGNPMKPLMLGGWERGGAGSGGVGSVFLFSFTMATGGSTVLASLHILQIWWRCQTAHHWCQTLYGTATP